MAELVSEGCHKLSLCGPAAIALRFIAGTMGRAPSYVADNMEPVACVRRVNPAGATGIIFALVASVPPPGILNEIMKQTFEENRMTMNRKQKGFSLIELLIVVAIILIIAAIAIPNLLRSRMAANEASAVGSIRTLNTASITYNSTYGNGFPVNLTMIGGTGAATCTNAGLIDSVLGGGQKSGYNFTLTGGITALTTSQSTCATKGYQEGYIAQAVPQTTGTTGQRAFCSDPSGVIRYNTAGTEGSSAPACNTAENPLQ
jgi:type IV pilus assembly protein PilA